MDTVVAIIQGSPLLQERKGVDKTERISARRKGYRQDEKDIDKTERISTRLKGYATCRKEKMDLLSDMCTIRSTESQKP